MALAIIDEKEAKPLRHDPVTGAVVLDSGASLDVEKHPVDTR